MVRLKFIINIYLCSQDKACNSADLFSLQELEWHNRRICIASQPKPFQPKHFQATSWTAPMRTTSTTCMPSGKRTRPASTHPGMLILLLKRVVLLIRSKHLQLSGKRQSSLNSLSWSHNCRQAPSVEPCPVQMQWEYLTNRSAWPCFWEHSWLTVTSLPILIPLTSRKFTKIAQVYRRNSDSLRSHWRNFWTHPTMGSLNKTWIKKSTTRTRTKAQFWNKNPNGKSEI